MKKAGYINLAIPGYLTISGRSADNLRTVHSDSDAKRPAID